MILTLKIAIEIVIPYLVYGQTRRHADFQSGNRTHLTNLHINKIKIASPVRGGTIKLLGSLGR